MNRTKTLAIALFAASAALASTASFAQAAPAPAGKTRAEVIAETKVALRNGEIGVGHEWALFQPQATTARPAPVKLATSTAQ